MQKWIIQLTFRVASVHITIHNPNSGYGQITENPEIPIQTKFIAH